MYLGVAGEILAASPTKLGIRKLHPLSLLLLNTVLEVPANSVKEKGETKSLFLNLTIIYLKNSKEAPQKAIN